MVDGGFTSANHSLQVYIISCFLINKSTSYLLLAKDLNFYKQYTRHINNNSFNKNDLIYLIKYTKAAESTGQIHGYCASNL